MEGEELDRLSCSWWDIFDCYPAQAAFVNASSRVNQIFLGGRGTGKTYALCLKALYLALRNGGRMVAGSVHHTPGALMGRTAKEIDDKLEPIFLGHVAKFKQATGINLIKGYSGKHSRYTLVNGAQIYKISKASTSSPFNSGKGCFASCIPSKVPAASQPAPCEDEAGTDVGVGTSRRRRTTNI